MATLVYFLSALLVSLNSVILVLTGSKEEPWQTRFHRATANNFSCDSIIDIERSNPFLSSDAHSHNFHSDSNTKNSNLESDDPTDMDRNNKTSYPLNIIGLFALTGEYPAGISYLPAALLAVKHVNEEPNLLPGYTLHLNAYDTEGRLSVAMDAIYTEVYNRKPTPIMVLGASRSHVTEGTAPVSYLWGMCQISYSAVSPYLSDKELFPSFFRVMTPEQNLTGARIQLMKSMNWSRVHVIYQNYKLFSTLVEALRLDLPKDNITVVSVQLFTDDPWDSVRALKALDARIVIGAFYDDRALQVMCAAFKLDVDKEWYKKVVWILPSFFDRGWMNRGERRRNCTSANIQEVAGNYFSVGSMTYLSEKGYKAVGIYPAGPRQDLYSKVKKVIPSQFRKVYGHCRDGRRCHLYAQHRATQAYDSVWAIALALNNTLNYLRKTGTNQTLRKFDFGCRDPDFPGIIRDQMQAVEFNAVSGPFAFNSLRDRTAAVEITRYVNEERKFITVGNCTYSRTKTGNWKCFVNKSSVSWKNTADGNPPFDGIQIRSRILKTEYQIIWTFSCLATISIVVSIGLLIFSIKHRNHVVVKRSSPLFNILILVGSILAYVTVILRRDADEGWDVAFCMIPTVTIVLSFSLGFGALLAKNWRVYQIFTAGTKVLNTKMLRDFNLCLFVIALLVVNNTVVTAWFIVSPETPTLVNISHTLLMDGSDIEYINQYRRCESEYGMHFTVALLTIQGTVMLFATFLANQLRKIPNAEHKLLESNYSKRFVWCVFHVIVLAPVAVIVVMATRDKPTINYALESTMTIIITSMTVTLIFVPKIIGFRQHNRKYTRKNRFRQCQIYILSNVDDGDALPCGQNNCTKPTKTSNNLDKTQGGSNPTGIEQHDQLSTLVTTRSDACQQTDDFVLTTSASVSNSPIIHRQKQKGLPKGGRLYSINALPGRCEVAMNFSTYSNRSRKRSKSDYFLRRFSFDAGFSSGRRASTREKTNVSGSNVLVQVKTDMTMKSRLEICRSRSDKRNDRFRMSHIQELLTSVNEGAPCDWDANFNG